MHFTIKGANRHTGEDIETTIEAPDRFHAEKLAREEGLLISEVVQVSQEIVTSAAPRRNQMPPMQPLQVVIHQASQPPSAPPPQAPPPHIVYAAPPTAAVTVQNFVQVNARRGTSTSGFGMAALVLGIIALLFCWLPFVGVLSIPIAALGLLLAALGFLISLVGRRSGVGMPFAGGACCALAIFVAVSVTGAASMALTKAMDDAGQRASEQSASRAGAQSPSREVERSKPAPPPQAASTPQEPQETPSQSSPQPVMAAAAPPQQQTPARDFQAELDAARSRLKAAKETCLARLVKTPEYVAAQKLAKDAEAKVLAARGSPERTNLTVLSAKWIEAKNALGKMEADAVSRDPDVNAALAAVSAAQKE
ncbi:MAG: hypothetical protein ACREJC_09665 [Tepidisphaeraceae bacterium]